MNRYRITFDGFTPHVPGMNYAWVVYHNRPDGPTPSSRSLMVLDYNDRWNADNG